MFFNPEARTFFPDWEQAANDIVAVLRGYAGRNPHDRTLRADWRARNAQRRIPHRLGRPQCALPPDRPQTHPPSRGW
ncbi:hypothetical protein [Arthrobacter sp. PAMC25564]|uniref:MmyB family transcriptional regulator n=1 Tax=Arthrobacter sp. PAMC25564 TaxID=2565366 RepID=UPI003211CC46